jgi:hypothetical protein
MPLSRDVLKKAVLILQATDEDAQQACAALIVVLPSSNERIRLIQIFD